MEYIVVRKNIDSHMFYTGNRPPWNYSWYKAKRMSLREAYLKCELVDDAVVIKDFESQPTPTEVEHAEVITK